MAYLGKEVLAPGTTQVLGTVEINVNEVSQVVTIAPDSGSSLSETDSCEVYLIIEDDASRTLATTELMGSGRPRLEIMSKGRYLIKRVKTTTENVGAYVRPGFQASR